VVCLQEINYLRTSRDLGGFIGGAIGSPPGELWQVVHVRDTMIATTDRLQEGGYRLVTGPFPLDLKQAAALVDLPDARYGSADLYLICSHFKSGGETSDIRLRSRQADVIASNLRDLLTPGGGLDLPPRTPIVILGDFNIYATDPARQAVTLLQGDVSDEAAYGEDLHPDWDGTDLADAEPSHNSQGIDFYTWRSDSPVFPWGALDRIFFTDSVLRLNHAFVLNTMLLSAEALARRGLQPGDVVLDPSTGYYDHLPLVADFSLLPVP
jgi:hypothetical protein